MKIFLDTEFTQLAPGNKLISIALVAENGEFFYAELNDTYELEECSDFVKVNVLPLLKGGKYLMSEKDCALGLANWIEERGPDCMLACDNPSWDRPFFDKLIDKIGIWPENLSKDEYFKFQIMDEVVFEITHVNGFKPHNALDDAKVMMIANQIGEAWEY